MGGGFNQEYVQATQYQADTNLNIAQSGNKADLEIAREQSKAVIKQAELDYKARVLEANTNKDVQMEALRVREKEAELQFKVDWKQAQNDAVRAEASKTIADAKVIEAESKTLREERRADRDRMRYESGGGGSYWYGY